MKRKQPTHRLYVENWGPVKKGEIIFKPLTIFIGPNNTGKSYIAMLYYALINSIRKALLQSIEKYLSSYMLRRVKNNIKDVIIEQDTMEHWKLIDYFTKSLSETLLKKEVERVFSSVISELVKNDSNASKILLKITDTYIEMNLDLMVWKNSDIKVSFNVNIPEELFEKELDTIDRVIIRLMNILGVDLHYLPASRAGIIHSYRSVASALVQLAPLTAISETRIPRFPGPLADFISKLISIEPVHAPFKGKQLSIIDRMEKIIEGSILLEKTGEELPPEIYYLSNGSRIPVSRASSMIAELAPLSIFLRYGVFKEGDTVIIEEPESHLHPDKQARLAEFFAELVNVLGVRVVITTHSDVFLSRISDLVSLSVLPDKELAETGYRRETTINVSDIAVYNFAKTSDGTIIEEVRVSEEGVEEEVFHKIIEELYEESMKTYYKVQEYVKKNRKSRETKDHSP